MQLSECITEGQVEAVNRTRRVCDKVASQVREVDTYEAGVIYAAATRAEQSLFNFLNMASAYGDCDAAKMALDIKGELASSDNDSDV